MRSPSTRSCSTAAGRWRSAPTRRGRRLWLLSSRASLAEAVVFAGRCRPAIITTLGGFDDVVSLPVVPPRVCTSSSLTILMTCCAGERLFATSAPWARSLTRRMKLGATRTLTSASSSATRSSRQTSLISLSVSFPRLLSLVKMPSKRSASVSNMGPFRLARGRHCFWCRSPVSEAVHRRQNGRLCIQEGGDEGLGFELHEVGGALPHPDELHGDAELGLDGEHDAALGGAVELGEHHPGDVDRLRELARLGEAVLAGGGVQHQQHLLERTGGAVDDALELLQLGHEVGLGVEPPSGVDE